MTSNATPPSRVRLQAHAGCVNEESWNVRSSPDAQQQEIKTVPKDGGSSPPPLGAVLAKLVNARDVEQISVG